MTRKLKYRTKDDETCRDVKSVKRNGMMEGVKSTENKSFTTTTRLTSVLLACSDIGFHCVISLAKQLQKVTTLYTL